MKATPKILCAACLLAGASVVHAEFSANVALTTDYIWRGVSQTDNDPAVQGGFDYAHPSGFYAGIWGSNVNFVGIDDAHMELTFWGGYATEFGPGVGWDVGLMRYTYPGTDDELDFTELYTGLSYQMFNATVAHSNDVFASGENGTYFNLGASFDLTADFSLGVNVGRYHFSSSAADALFGPDLPRRYTDWRVALATEYQGFGFELAYTDTDSKGNELFGDVADSRVVFTVSRAM